ncbi:MAG: tetratricopeptide repeat protein [Acidobacteriota bacterium]
MARLEAFLPPLLLRAVPPERFPRADRLRAALLVSDISGFTALTERLEAHGREGAEEIAAVVSRAFRPAIRAIDSAGGGIVSFGGDALFAVFPGAGAVARAATAAEAIRQAFDDLGDVRTSSGTVRLGITQAIHWGPIAGVHLGTLETAHYVVTGRSVAAVARLSARAKPGEVLVSRAARARAAGRRAAVGRQRRQLVGTRLSAYLPRRLLRSLARPDGAYRRVAILFLESRGSRLRALQELFLSLTQILDRYDGVLMKTDVSSRGTKWLCVFGLPEIHEDDVERAGHAAWELLHAVPRGTARGGLHPGTVANVTIGTAGRRSFDVMGDAVNTAARALGGAAWGEVVATDAARLLLAGIDTRDRGTIRAKGKAEPLRLHAISGVRPRSYDVAAAVTLVGRDAELHAIGEAIESAREGTGAVVAVEGEAGVGKSRLVWEGARLARLLMFEVHHGRAIAFGGMAYWAIAEVLRSLLSVSERSSREEVLAAIDATKGRLPLGRVDRDHLAEVLGARRDRSPVAHLRPEDIRLNNTIAIRNAVLARARSTPLLIVMEDMHLSDPLTREAVEWLSGATATARVVLLLVSRPGYAAPGNASALRLGELDAASAGRMFAALLPGASDEVARAAAERAAGNPFYVEQIARHVAEGGRLADLPGSVEALIAARLDRLAPDAREVAQLAAASGRSVPFDVLSALHSAARAGIDELERGDLLVARTGAHGVEYMWRHALARDVAYRGMLASRRRRIHREIARLLESRFGDLYLAMIGHHWEKAGAAAAARRFYLAAARRATAIFAHEDAGQLYESYLRLAGRPTPERVAARNELGNRVYLCRGRVTDAELAHGAALEDARRIGDRSGIAASLKGLGDAERQSGRFEAARATYEESLAIRHELGEHALEGALHGNLGNLCGEQGRMDEARDHLEKAVSMARAARDRAGEGVSLGNLANLLGGFALLSEARALHGMALAIAREVGDRRYEGVVLNNLSNASWRQGKLDHARAFRERALGIAREVGDRSLEGVVLGNLAVLEVEAGRTAVAWTLYEEALAIARECRSRRAEGTVLGNLANLHKHEGRMDAARALYDEGIAIAREMGDSVSETHHLVNVADLERWTGQVTESLRTARDAEDLARRAGDRLALAHALVARGRALLAAGRDATEAIREATMLASDARVSAQSDLGGDVAGLVGAQEAFTHGRPLVAGVVAGEVPPGIRRFLRLPGGP